MDINLQVYSVKIQLNSTIQIKGATALRYSYFGHDQAPHILSYVGCYSSGSYTSLLQCSHNSLHATINCGDGAVASAVCLGNELSICTC